MKGTNCVQRVSPPPPSWTTGGREFSGRVVPGRRRWWVSPPLPGVAIATAAIGPASVFGVFHPTTESPTESRGADAPDDWLPFAAPTPPDVRATAPMWPTRSAPDWSKPSENLNAPWTQHPRHPHERPDIQLSYSRIFIPLLYYLFRGPRAKFTHVSLQSPDKHCRISPDLYHRAEERYSLVNRRKISRGKMSVPMFIGAYVLLCRIYVLLCVRISFTFLHF